LTYDSTYVDARAGVIFARRDMAHLKLTKNTYSARPKDIERKWYLVDAEGQVLGRLATQVATVLRGKHKAIYTPSMDTGDHVIVINASRVAVTGDKANQKVYYHHSGYPGGLKETPYEVMLERRPEQIIIHAVRGMLPKNRLGRAMLGKLHVYAGGEHPHEAQKPEPLKLEG
jgi:large subunit ribosomal protein L13